MQHALPLHITRSKQDKATLKDWCRGFGLHHSGNKTAIKNELRDFSQSQTAWDQYLSLYLKFIHTLFDSLLPGACCTHYHRKGTIIRRASLEKKLVQA
jgi:hypothetical protein